MPVVAPPPSCAYGPRSLSSRNSARCSRTTVVRDAIGAEHVVLRLPAEPRQAAVRGIGRERLTRRHVLCIGGRRLVVDVIILERCGVVVSPQCFADGNRIGRPIRDPRQFGERAVPEDPAADVELAQAIDSLVPHIVGGGRGRRRNKHELRRIAGTHKEGNHRSRGRPEGGVFVDVLGWVDVAERHEFVRGRLLHIRQEIGQPTDLVLGGLPTRRRIFFARLEVAWREHAVDIVVILQR